MKLQISQFGQTILTILVVSFFFTTIPLLMEKASDLILEDRSVIIGDYQYIDQLEKPTLLVECSSSIEWNSVFNYYNYIMEAKSSSGESLKDSVIMYGEVDTTQKGGYDVRFVVYDEYDLKTEVSCSFVVE
ncbi:hypothetical protein [Tannockella kyphosi]|uniref:hypothetical protein n=1 Tax=Tannockella kyphosi TaxID=2899121 RepID=UPI0020121626|nr:hypothetical protein [Tannockella kyphosi]